MNINYLLSLTIILFSSVTVFKITRFANDNKLSNSTFLWAYSGLLFLFCVFFSLEMVSSSITLMRNFSILKTVAFSFLPAVIFLIFLDISKAISKIKFFHYILILIMPVISAALSLTSNYHNLFFYGYSIQSYSGITFMNVQYGVWFYIFSVYIEVLVILSFISVLKSYIKSVRKLRIYIIVLTLIAASSIIVMIYALKQNSMFTLFSPLFLPISSLLLSINSVSYKLFGVIPYAYKKAFEWAENSKLILDNDLVILDYNEEAEECVPLVNESALRKNLKDILDYDDRIKNSILTETECRIRIIKDFSVRHYRVSSSALYDSFKRKMGYMISLIDITELVETMAELTELASVDMLTRTQTRRYFIEMSDLEFARAKRHCHPISFVILDLDHFKNINDKFGHLAGDKILKEIADICKTKIRAIDLLGRFGGEEFMLLFPETDIEGAIAVAERIRQKVEETEFKYEDKIIKLTISLGITGADSIVDENFDTFLRYADIALYRAKEKGRNRTEYLLCQDEEEAG